MPGGVVGVARHRPLGQIPARLAEAGPLGGGQGRIVALPEVPGSRPPEQAVVVGRAAEGVVEDLLGLVHRRGVVPVAPQLLDPPAGLGGRRRRDPGGERGHGQKDDAGQLHPLTIALY